MRPSHAGRQVSDRTAVTSSPTGSEDLKTLYVFICFPTFTFSREYTLMGFDQVPCTLVSLPTRHSHLWFTLSFQRSSMARPMRHPPLTRHHPRPPPASPSHRLFTPILIHDLSAREYTTRQFLTCAPYSPRTQLGNFLRCHASNPR